MTEPELKLYYDYKSPFAYLAAQPAFELPTRYAIRLRWLPFQLRIKGPGQRSVYSDWKRRLLPALHGAGLRPLLPPRARDRRARRN
jgi:hypothetical protein